MLNITHKSQMTYSGPAVKKNKNRDLGSRGTASNKFESQSGMPTGLQNTGIGNMPNEIDTDPLMQDLLFSQDPASRSVVQRLYKDIYYNDAVGGSAVDLYSTMPFSSEFALGGMNDDKFMRPYLETCERLNLRTLIQEASVDLMVSGAFLGSLLYDRSKKRFIDIMTHRIEDADITGLPFYGQDPIIQVAIPKELRDMLSGTSESQRIQSLIKMLGPEVTETLQREKLELEPLSTIYVPRKTFSTNPLGTSYYRRILPLYLIEKNLYRGTLVESSRRQRGILHLTLGDESWEPTTGDMEFMTDLFMNADADPLGAVIATRMGLSTEELRQGGDFWKVTDIWDQTTQFKLRALGISEAFLSGDASYSNSDTSLTVFMESLRAFRDMMTRKVFYNKVFPLVSLINGFTVNRRGKVVKKDGLMNGSTDEVLETMQDGSKLLIPSVHWAKQLKPEGDQMYLEMLTALTEKGVPVPLRAFAAAGGFNLDELLQQQDDDMVLQEKIYAYQKTLQELKKANGPAGEEDDDMGSFSSGLGRLTDTSIGSEYKSTVLQGKGRPSILDRDFGESGEVVGQTKTGKPKRIYDQNRAQTKANDKIMRSLKALEKRPNHLSQSTVSSKRVSEKDKRILNKLI